MLDLKKSVVSSSLPNEKEIYKRQIKSTDRKIDDLIYELYGLTEEEKVTIENFAL